MSFGSSYFHVLCFVGITKEPSFISKRRVPHHDPQISKYLEWNGAVRDNDAVVPPEPQATRTPKPKEAEQREDANPEAAPSLEAARVPKRTRSHSADSRAEGAPDSVEKHRGITRNHAPVNVDAELRPPTKPLPESIDPRVGPATMFLFKSIFRFFYFLFFICSLVPCLWYRCQQAVTVTEKGCVLNGRDFVLNVLRHALPTRAHCLRILFNRAQGSSPQDEVTRRQEGSRPLLRPGAQLTCACLV